ncbi:MAG: alpha-L-arabinofuranosidase [Lachnospiraceae bacterium]|nr:alpha-L-arabinofuranosidase [Lachnospiraceae bacterium]
MSKKAKVSVNPNFKIGEISKRLYGAFLEPIGTMVNGSMYNPNHPTADEQGFRKDWIDALKEFGIPAVRLPGGNFVSGWDWKDSIGPKDLRKKHLDLAWHQYYTNDIGHDEYLQWTEKIGAEPMYTLNLGTGDINDAVYNVEYTNHEGGTYWSDLRKKNGHDKPYGVKMWYLGNEMDGPWQVASWEKDPKAYGVKANEVSKAIKWVDGTIETAVCVSSSPDVLHYPDWDEKVLRECYNSVDYVSLHMYQSAAIGNYAQFMAAARYYEDYIRTEIGLCDYVQTLCRSPKKMMLSFDEYGTMFLPQQEIHFGREVYIEPGTYYPQHNDREYILHDPNNMGEMYSHRFGSPILSALGNAGVLLEMLRHADRVKIACMTGGLGTAATTSAEGVYITPGHYTYLDLLRYGQGVSLTPVVECEKFDVASFAIDDNHKSPEQKDVDLIDCAAAFNEEKGELTVFVINRDWEEDAEFTLNVSELDGYRFDSHYEMFSEDLESNDAAPVKNEETKADGTVVTAGLKKLSWNVFRFVKD